MGASATDGARPDLEGLRDVAILLVVACHVSNMLFDRTAAQWAALQ